MAAVTVLFMSFFLLQAGLRLLARPERALEKTLETATQQLNQLSPAASNPLENQVAALLDMALPMVAALPQQRKKH